MNKNILFVGSLGHQHIQGFVSSLKSQSDLVFYGISYSENVPTNGLFEEVTTVGNTKNKVINQFLRIVKPIGCIFRLRKKVSVVQFHALSIYAFMSAPLARLFGLKVSYFIWGSDLMRANKFQRLLASIVYHSVHSVVCDSSSVKDIFCTRYPVLKDKIVVNYFGSPVIDKMNELLKNENKLERNNNLYKGKIVVMCGYNASPEQNHINIIRALSKHRNEVHLILPMTYRKSAGYSEKVKEELERLNFSYTFLEDFLADEEMCKYEIDTDVFIHMQQTDAFSSSVAEHLFLGNVVINAEWIIYPDLINNGVIYKSANFSNLENIIDDTLVNLNMYKSEASQNKNKIYELKSQLYCNERYWIPYYESLLVK